MSSDILLRIFDRSKDYASQRELFSLSFPETTGSSASTDRHYRWKFLEFPHEPSSYEFVAEQSGDIVGYYAAIPYEYRVRGERKVCGMVCDVMTHPRMRGKGVFTKIGRFATEELRQDPRIDFVSGYPIRPEVIPGHLKVGWFIAFKLPMYLKPLRSNLFFKNKWADVLIHPIVNLFLKTGHFLLHLFAEDLSPLKILNRAEFLSETRYEKFRIQWEKHQRNYLVKTREFIDWRTRAPETEYFFFTLNEGSDLKAVLIVRKVELKGIPVLAIIDWMSLPDVQSKELAKIHTSLFRFARERSCDAIVSMIGRPWARKYRFLRFGFLPSPAVFSIIFKLLKPDLKESDFYNVEDWHLMWIDSDDL